MATCAVRYTVVSYGTPKSASNEAVRGGYRVDRARGTYHRNPEGAATRIADFGIRRLCHRAAGGGQPTDQKCESSIVIQPVNPHTARELRTRRRTL